MGYPTGEPDPVYTAWTTDAPLDFQFAEIRLNWIKLN